MWRKIVALLAGITLVIGLSGCTKKKESANQNQSPGTQTSESKSETVQEIKAMPVAAPDNFQRTLVGTLDNRIAIQMQLHRQDEQVYGTYFYEKIRDPLELFGKIDKNGNCKITESANGEDTGIFKGKLIGIDTGTGTKIRFEGTWSKPNGEKPMPFSLQEQEVNLSGGMKLITKERKEESKKQHYEIDLFYPLIEGANDERAAGFNKAVLKIIEDGIKDFKTSAADAYDKTNKDAPPSSLSLAHDISLANDDFISVVFTESVYSSGAAHPSSFFLTLNYDLQKGREVKLADLFNSGTSYIQVISNYCLKSLTSQLKKIDALDEETVKTGAGADAENFKKWSVTREGLLFSFDPYQVAAYAAGPQEVLIPYAVLKGIMKTDNPISTVTNRSGVAK